MKSPFIISVVVLTYNSQDWIEKCLASLGSQTIAAEVQIIVADNQSSDQTVARANQFRNLLPNFLIKELGGNFGYCEGNNRAAQFAAGEYLLFLNPDIWLEPDCLEILIGEVRAAGAQAAQPAIFSYTGNEPDSYGVDGLDFMGTFSQTQPCREIKKIMVVGGCCFLIEKTIFERLGGFDNQFFMYNDEDDLSFRLWLAGYKAVVVPNAILHHRGTSHVNPSGEKQIIEYRTTANARYLATRNGLLTLWKNSQHILLTLAVSYIFFHLLEFIVALALTRNWKFAKRAYLEALRDAWKMRQHVFAERKKIKNLRVRSDWWMLRFLRLRPNRWQLFIKMLKIGVPKVK
jgi:GT2 family glycosyltransferase